MSHKIINTFLLASIDRELYSNNIGGSIPSELGNLTNLVSLDLYLNSFTGPIPESLGKLSKLRFLYVYNPSSGLCYAILIMFTLKFLPSCSFLHVTPHACCFSD